MELLASLCMVPYPLAAEASFYSIYPVSDRDSVPLYDRDHF